MEIRLTFALTPNEWNTEPAELLAADGLTPAQLADESGAASITVGRGYGGKGGAAAALELAVHIVEESLTDAASLYACGQIVAAVIRRVRRQRDRPVGNQDPTAIAALAVSADSSNGARMVGGYFTAVKCLTGGGDGMGTDVTDVWATAIVLADADVLVVFSSPSGLVLGEVVVPPEWTSRRGVLDAAAARATFMSLNGWSDK
jgi:hypothetical protein